MTSFIKSFERLLKIWDFGIKFEEILFPLYKENRQENNWWLKMKYYEMLRNNDSNLWDLLHFIKYIWDNDWFKDHDLEESFKNEIIKPSKLYKKNFYLSCLFSINYDNFQYYTDLYDEIINTAQFDIDTAEIFLAMFIKNNDFARFINCSIYIISNRRYSFDDDRIRKYLCQLNDKQFRKWLLEIFEYFTKNENKKNFEKYYDYKWIIDFDSRDEGEDYWFYKDKKAIIDNLLDKIKLVSFPKKEKKIILNFLFSEMNIYNEHYWKIESNYFYKNLFTIECAKDDLNLIYFLKTTNIINLTYSMNLFFICKFLNENNLEKCLLLYKKVDVKEFYNVYLCLKEQWKKKIIWVIKKDKQLFSMISAIDKERNKSKKKWEKENRLREEKRKIALFSRLNPESWFDFKFLADYEYYLKDKSILNSLSSDEEDQLKEAAKQQCLKYLERLNIDSYSDKKIKDLIHYEKNWDSYTLSQIDRVLYVIYNISRKSNFDISKYYKLYVLNLPFFHWNALKKEIFPFIEDKLDKSDINFLLRLYKEDLHDRAIWLRFYNVDSFILLWNKLLEINVTKGQLKKMRLITIDFIESDEVLYKWELIELLSKLSKRKKEFKKFYHEPRVNYFKSIVSDEEPVSEDEKKEYEKQLKFNEFLITRYNDLDALKRRINQIKDGVIKCEDSFENIDESWNVTLWRGFSRLEEELRFSRGSYLGLSYLVKGSKSEKIRDQMLEIFGIWLEISSRDWYKLYAQYLVNIFSEYIRNIEESRPYNLKIINLINQYPDTNLYLLDIKKYCYTGDDGFINENPRNIALEKNEKLVQYENELNVLRRLLEMKECKWVVFCEWWTDKTIIETARDKLNPWIKKDFYILPVWWARWIVESVKNMDIKIYKIWILDFDNEWYYAFSNSGKSFHLLEGINYTWLIKWDWIEKEFLLTLPVPTGKKWLASEQLWTYSMITIESIFDENVFNWFFSATTDLSCRGDDSKWIKVFISPLIEQLYKPKYPNDSSEKVNFSRYVSKLDKQSFENFKPLFEQINCILEWKYD